MKKLIVGAFLALGVYVGAYLGLLACYNLISPLVRAVEVYQTDISFSEGMTKTLPDYQLQPALAIQGTVGVE